MKNSIYNKKNWLLQRADLIVTLKENGLNHQHIIEHLKQHEQMPFDLEQSLFSRYYRQILEQRTEQQDKIQLTEQLNALQKYSDYLEDSNKQLILKNKTLHNIKQPILNSTALSEDDDTLEQFLDEIQTLRNELQQRQQQHDSAQSEYQKHLSQLSAKYENLLLEKLALEQNDDLEQENTRIKRDIKRLEHDLARNLKESLYLEEKLNLVQIRAKQSLIVIAFLIILSIGLSIQLIRA